MKKLCTMLALICVVFGNSLKAQTWMPLSQEFADYLTPFLAPGAISGNSLNVDDYSVYNLQDLTIQDNLNRPMDITGIDYLYNLQRLTILSDFSITKLPLLPSTLQSLTMNCFNLNKIRDLSGPSLDYLFIYGATALDSVPPLSNSITYIEIVRSGIKALPNIPSSLRDLSIYECKSITALPALNNSLQTLNASLSGLTAINSFPSSLRSIDLSYTPLTNLASLPPRLDYLNLSFTNVVYTQTTDIIINQAGVVNLDSCSGISAYNFAGKIKWDSTQGMGGISFYAQNNGLNSFPPFRTFIEICELSGNPFSSVPVLPNFRDCNLFPGACHAFSSLKELHLRNCGLPSLSTAALQLPKLNILDLSGNNFQSLNIDSFQAVTKRLDLNYCNISTLTSSGLYTKQINLYGNNIICLPYIGDSVTTLQIGGNPLVCLPNIPKNVTLNFPLCTTPCGSLPIISGIVFNDLNKDGIKNNGEQGTRDVLVKINPEGRIAKTDSTGKYQFRCLPGGPYDLVAYPHSMYGYITTPAPALHLTGVVSGSVDSLKHIGIYTTVSDDLLIKVTSLSLPRPGFAIVYNITVSNPGTTTQNGTASLQFDPSLIFQSASSSGIRAGDSITWLFSNLLPGAAVQYNAIFKVPTTTLLGTSLCARAIANGNTPDTSSYNNLDYTCQFVTGSYDPNDKTAYPGEVLTKEQMVSGEGIDYVVRFQNTGTASAINVRVEDTISPFMEAATIRMIASSHVNEWHIDSGNVLKVFFNNINLPDSGANELLSHGFFRYSIKPKAGTAIGDSIKNTALIYFDFNAPIVTNTVKTDVTTLFAIPIAPQTVCEGQPLNLNFTDNPAISKIEWLRNDTALGLFGPSLNIPNATLAQNGQYSVRITLNNEAVFTSAKSTVTISPSYTPSVSIAQTTQNACAGDAVSFTATPNNGGTTPVYQWLINGAVNFSGGDVLSVTLNSNDEVKAVMTSSLSCVTTPNDTSNVLLAAMDTLAKTSVSIVAPTGTCEGQSLSLSTTAGNAGSSPVYAWSINGQVVPNVNTAALTATLQNNDVVEVKLISSLQCVTEDTVSATQNITTTAVVVPTIALTTSAANDICNGASQSFTVAATGQGQAPVYTWLLNGTAVPGLNGDSIQLTNLATGDIVQALLQSSAACASPAQVASGTDTVEVHTVPAQPLITQSGSTLTSDATQGIQWLLNGNAIPGATSATYTAEVNGVYSVLVTDGNGCSALSDTIGMRVLSLGSIDISTSASVYPNPFLSQLTLQLEGKINAADWNYKLVNVSGQTIQQAVISQNTTTLNLQQLAAGVYMLHVQHAGDSKAFRVVKY